jgi:hypothetical protein
MSITSANAVLMLSVATVFPTPQQIIDFSVDDAFEIDPIEPSEVRMGVDGYLTAGFVYVPVPLRVTLMADSPSITFFDQWYASQKAQQDVYVCNGIIRMLSVSRSYNLDTGYLTSYSPITNAKRVLDPVRYQITFRSITGAPV